MCVSGNVRECVWMCVRERVRESERERKRKKEREREKEKEKSVFSNWVPF